MRISGRKKTILAGIILGVSVIIALWVILGGGAVPVRTASVIQGSIAGFIEESAVVKMEDSVQLHALAGGMVQDIYKKEGDPVVRGDLILTLDPTAAALQLSAAQADYDALKANYDYALNPDNTAALSKAQAALESAAIHYEEALRNHQALEALFETGGVSREALRQSQAQLNLLESAKTMAQSDYDLAVRGLTQTQKQEYEARLSAAAAQIQLAEDQLSHTRVLAEHTGSLITLTAKKGSYLSPGALIGVIGNAANLYLEADVLVSDIVDIRIGSPAVVSNEDLRLYDIEGAVRFIAPGAFTKISDLGIEQKAVKVEIAMNHPPALLRPEYDMNVRMITAQSENCLLIPDTAVFDYLQGDYVFVAEGGRARLRPVVTGIESGGQIEIKEGLAPDEAVILSPDPALKEGSRVK
jgi:HlyD family secretion protein